ncbi:Sulfite reductase (NADPH) hemoprotein beta-component [Rubrivivax sp. A210]|uniref:nitrite/sulfite reductase n=1 Tax=Rubrivivax sp. A210 TaxID=2772301 RepID=UPI00191A1E40|nr:nitrite/sulfite reductase [Rubrivivax sp. A210]CAD5366484.1 Sulfite reductase (NADPH) hemoprotein beta-component [Rubrivivax sp. A210]
MYAYTDFDREFVRARAAQFRDQLQRNLAGELADDDFRPLRLQNGWYVQRHAPMLRVAVPYGELAARQLRQLARIAREHDRQDAGLPTERGGFGHFSTRQNLQFNWIPLPQSADVMDLLADVDMHGIQTSGNCIRNITTDALAGIAPDEEVDPRPYCELLRQWSTLHPEFAFLPRKFKIAVTGAREDRAATAWHDIGLTLRRNAAGEVGFAVAVGGGMGRTPVIAVPFHAFVPWREILVYIEAIVRQYNLHGRRDNMYKARIKILVKAEGQRFVDAVNREYEALRADPATPLIPAAELDRVAAHFQPLPPLPVLPTAAATPPLPAYERWLQRNVHGHRVPGYKAVTLSLKRPGLPPGDITADQMDAAAELAERFSHAELRVTHDQNLLLPWVRETDLRALWLDAREDGFATPNIGLLTDMIACPGGDLCALANARSIPIAAAITERFDDLDELHDIGDIDLHISGCINSCGHHHSGHIGILGVDKDGSEWYQVTVAGSDGSAISGPSVAGKVIGPSFAADEVPDVMEAVIAVYLRERQAGERFIDTSRRLGPLPFRRAADEVRRSTAAVD